MVRFGSVFVDFVSVVCKWAKLRMLVVVVELDVDQAGSHKLNLN